MAEVVQVAQQTPKPSGFGAIFGFLKSPVFWEVLVIIILIALLIIGVVFLIKWIVSFLKARSNIFFQLRKQRIMLCKIHSRFPSSNHYWKVHKNIPIRLVKNIEGRPVLSDPIAYYRGDYVSHEGNIIVALNLKDRKKMFFFPISDILIIPNKENTTLQQRDEKGNTSKIKINNLPLAKDIIKFNDNEILLYADSISNIGSKGNDFYVPVLTAKDGKIIDLSLPIYQSIKDVIVGDYLMEQSDEFVKVTKKSIDLNPNLRYTVKTSDNSSAVEVPQQQ